MPKLVDVYERMLELTPQELQAERRAAFARLRLNPGDPVFDLFQTFVLQGLELERHIRELESTLNRNATALYDGSNRIAASTGTCAKAVAEVNDIAKKMRWAPILSFALMTFLVGYFLATIVQSTYFQKKWDVKIGLLEANNTESAEIAIKLSERGIRVFHGTDSDGAFCIWYSRKADFYFDNPPSSLIFK